MGSTSSLHFQCFSSVVKYAVFGTAPTRQGGVEGAALEQNPACGAPCACLCFPALPSESRWPQAGPYEKDIIASCPLFFHRLRSFFSFGFGQWHGGGGRCYKALRSPHWRSSAGPSIFSRPTRCVQPQRHIHFSTSFYLRLIVL